MTVTNGAVFLMDPTAGPSGTVLVAQVTVSDSSSSVVLNAQGASADGGNDWQQEGIVFYFAAGTCTDDDSFVDAQGYDCDGWFGYDCADSLSWGFTAEEEAAIFSACPATCGICPDDCSDDPFFVDAQGYDCTGSVSYTHLTLPTKA